MTSRTLVVLAAALVVLALLAVYGQRSDLPRESQSGALLLPDLQADLGQIDRVRVIGAEGATLATLERRSDNWIVAEKQGYPADITKIRDVLGSLAEARIVEQKTANPDYYDRLGVQAVDAADATGVEVRALAGDAVHASVIAGDLAGGGLQYLRVSDVPTSYLVDQEIEVPRDTVGWIDPGIVDVAGARVAAVTIEHPDGEVLRLSKDDAAETNFAVDGIPDGRELSYPGVANVIGNTLRDLRLDDVAAASDAEESVEPIRTTFRTFDGLIVTAMSFERGDETWVRFAADAAAGSDDAGGSDDAATSFSAGAPEGSAGDSAEGTDGDSAEGTDGSADASTSTDGEAVREEAERINARVAGWEYKIPSYQAEQLTRRMEDLLSAPQGE